MEGKERLFSSVGAKFLQKKKKKKKEPEIYNIRVVSPSILTSDGHNRKNHVGGELQNTSPL